MKSGEEWKGRSLREIHAKFNLSEKDYDDWMHCFKLALIEIGMNESKANNVIESLG
jgi:truncated hemoglobin YjbI